jgi:outer membrane protein
MQRIILLLVIVLTTTGLGLNAQQRMSLDDCVSYGLSNHPQVKIAQLQVVEADWQIKENTAGGYPQISAGLGYTGFIQRGGLPSGALSFGGGGGGPIPPVVYEQFTNGQVDALGAFLGAAFASDPNSKIYFSPVHSISADLSANQLIFSNSYLIAKKAARFYRDYVNDQLAVTRTTLRNQITDAYMPALLISENLKTLDKNITNLEKLLNETKEVNKAGFVEQLDVDRLELSLSTIRSERSNLVRQQEIVINALKMTMGFPVGDAIALSDDTEKLMTQFADADMTSPLNLMDRPEYSNLLKGRELSLLQVKLYEKTWMPTVAGYLQLQGGYQGGFGEKGSATHNDWYLIPSTVGGLKVTSNLFDSGISKAKKQRAMIAVQTIDEQKKLLENGFAMELETARKLYLNAQERVLSQQKNLDLAQRIFNTTQTKYKAGIGSSFEMVQAEQSLYTSQQGLMTARFDLLTARVAVKKALGKL